MRRRLARVAAHRLVRFEVLGGALCLGLRKPMVLGITSSVKMLQVKMPTMMSAAAVTARTLCLNPLRTACRAGVS